MGRFYSLAAILASILTTTSALAHESDEGYGYQPLDQVAPGNPFGTKLYFDIEPGRRIHKYELALRSLGIPPEPQPDFTHFPNAGEASMEGFLETSRFIDPKGALKRYLDLQPTRIDLFRDFFDHLLTPDFLEYSVDVLKDGPSQDSPDLMNRLKEIATQARTKANPRPLKGVRIAIDPGHMGNDIWDDITGKFVKIKDRTVSEGQLTMWTAFLTANALEKLGATVMVTRQDLAPVSRKDYKNYDYSQYLNQFFYDSLDADWLSEHFHLGDGEFIKKVKSLKEVKEKLPETAEGKQKVMTSFFISGEDLEARAQLITVFKPDLTIDIHYDATDSRLLQHTADNVEGYVPGQFSLTETGSRGTKALAFQHALEARRWNESVSFTSSITQAMSKQLGIPLEDASVMKIKDQVVAVKVKNGVYARNLYITRRSLHGLVAYLECLHYDYDVATYNKKTKKTTHSGEFYQLSNRDKKGDYKGLPIRYPHRLDKVAAGISEGVLQYFQNLPENPGVIDFTPEEIDHGPVEINEKIGDALHTSSHFSF